ncbi:hypothetical protein [uncultured Mediterranean phage uvMED]|nr:hypothetical protein [uncultured Mediterranean phage uvMED]
MDSKKCSKCKEVKSVSDFYKRNKITYMEVSARCKGCERNWQRSYKRELKKKGVLKSVKTPELDKRFPDYVLMQNYRKIQRVLKEKSLEPQFNFQNFKTYCNQQTDFRNLFIIYHSKEFSINHKPVVLLKQGRKGVFLKDYLVTTKSGSSCCG